MGAGNSHLSNEAPVKSITIPKDSAKHFRCGIRALISLVYQIEGRYRKNLLSINEYSVAIDQYKLINEFCKNDSKSKKLGIDKVMGYLMGERNETIKTMEQVIKILTKFAEEHAQEILKLVYKDKHTAADTKMFVDAFINPKDNISEINREIGCVLMIELIFGAFMNMIRDNGFTEIEPDRCVWDLVNRQNSTKLVTSIDDYSGSYKETALNNSNSELDLLHKDYFKKKNSGIVDSSPVSMEINFGENVIHNRMDESDILCLEASVSADLFWRTNSLIIPIPAKFSEDKCPLQVLNILVQPRQSKLFETEIFVASFKTKSIIAHLRSSDLRDPVKSICLIPLKTKDSNAPKGEYKSCFVVLDAPGIFKSGQFLTEDDWEIKKENQQQVVDFINSSGFIDSSGSGPLKSGDFSNNVRIRPSLHILAFEEESFGVHQRKKIIKWESFSYHHVLCISICLGIFSVIWSGKKIENNKNRYAQVPLFTSNVKHNPMLEAIKTYMTNSETMERSIEYFMNVYEMLLQSGSLPGHSMSDFLSPLPKSEPQPQNESVDPENNKTLFSSFKNVVSSVASNLTSSAIDVESKISSDDIIRASEGVPLVLEGIIRLIDIRDKSIAEANNVYRSTKSIFSYGNNTLKDFYSLKYFDASTEFKSKNMWIPKGSSISGEISIDKVSTDDGRRTATQKYSERHEPAIICVKFDDGDASAPESEKEESNLRNLVMIVKNKKKNENEAGTQLSLAEINYDTKKVSVSYFSVLRKTADTDNQESFKIDGINIKKYFIPSSGKYEMDAAEFNDNYQVLYGFYSLFVQSK